MEKRRMNTFMFICFQISSHFPPHHPCVREGKAHGDASPVESTNLATSTTVSSAALLLPLAIVIGNKL